MTGVNRDREQKIVEKEAAKLDIKSDYVGSYEFSKDGLRYWRVESIGDGKLISPAKVKAAFPHPPVIQIDFEIMCGHTVKVIHNVLFLCKFLYHETHKASILNFYADENKTISQTGVCTFPVINCSE